MTAPPRAVLIVRLSSIGDVVHTIPAFMALRRALPDTRIGWAVETAAADVVRALPGPLRVHEIPLQSWRRGALAPATWRAAWAARAELRAANYEVALDFQGLLKSALVARLSGAEVLGMHRRDAREPLATRMYARTAAPAPLAHVIRRSLQVASLVGADPVTIDFPALFNAADLARVEHAVAAQGWNRFVVIHSAANWSSKRYDPERWVAVGRRLHQETGMEVIWIWGPGERDATAEMARQAGAGNHLAFATRLPELAALVHCAELFVGGDSAPLHIAVACGTPVVALFGPTDPTRLGPLDPHDLVVSEKLPCSHCHRRRCPLGTRQCLEDIRPETLVQAALARLETRR